MAANNSILIKMHKNLQVRCNNCTSNSSIIPSPRLGEMDLLKIIHRFNFRIFYFILIRNKSQFLQSLRTK